MVKTKADKGAGKARQDKGSCKSRHAQQQQQARVAPCSHRRLVIGSYAEEGEPRFIIRYLDRPYRAIAWRTAGTTGAHPPTRESSSSVGECIREAGHRHL